MPKPKRDKDNIRVGKNIVLIKKACRMTYEEFSAAFGIGESVLTKLQGGTYHLPDEAIAEIALKTQIPFDSIKYDEDFESSEEYKSFKNKYFGKSVKEVLNEFDSLGEKYINVSFPIETDSKSLKSKKFREAFKLISLDKEFVEEDLNKIIKLLNESIKENASGVAYLNILSCLGRFFLSITNGVDDNKLPKINQERIILSKNDFLEEAKKAIDKDMADKNRQHYLDNYFDIQEETLEALVNDGNYNEYVQFFLAQKYVYNLFPFEEMHLDDDKRILIGAHMISAAVEMHNKYALSMLEVQEKIYY